MGLGLVLWFCLNAVYATAYPDDGLAPESRLDELRNTLKKKHSGLVATKVKIFGKQYIVHNREGVYSTVSGNSARGFESIRVIRAIDQAGLIQNGDKVLVIGVGNGIDAIAARLKGAIVDGIDIDPQSVELAKFNLDFLGLQDNTNIFLHNGVEGLGSYDVIIWNVNEPTDRMLYDNRYRIHSDRMLEILSDLPNHLTPKGFALWGLYFNRFHIWKELFEKANLQYEILIRKSFPNPNMEALPYRSGAVRLTPEKAKAPIKENDAFPNINTPFETSL